MGVYLKLKCHKCDSEISVKELKDQGKVTILCKNCGCHIVYGKISKETEITHVVFVPKIEYDKDHYIKKLADKNPNIKVKSS